MKEAKNKEQKHLSRNKIAALIAAATLVLTSTALISGTLAWFSYATHAYVTYNGTTVGGNEQLDIGVRISESYYHQNPSLEAKYKEIEHKDGYVIYWTDEILKPDMVQPIIAYLGTAVDTLHPVTTGAYTSGNPTYYHSPTYLKNYIEETKLADNNDFQRLDLAFRVKKDSFDGESNFEKGVPIYFTKAILESDTNIYKAARFHVTDGSTHHVISPVREDGYTSVGGVLDLNGDGLYDSSMHNDGKIYEYVYGQYESVSYKDTPNGQESPIPVEERTTFYANHLEGSYSLEDSCTPKKVYYEAMKNFKVGKTPIATTNESDGYAYISFDTYVEGWDKSVIDKEIGSKFNLEIRFEIE